MGAKSGGRGAGSEIGRAPGFTPTLSNSLWYFEERVSFARASLRDDEEVVG
jgi:hypothetical protein